MLSRRHATLTWDEAGDAYAWLLEDLGTQNGTSVNGNRLSGGAHVLEEGDIVCFGHAAGSTPSEVTYRFVASCAPREPCESSEY